jgi:hypothetical protein
MIRAQKEQYVIELYKQDKTIINGKVPDVKDANFGSDFRTARYAIILLAALMSPLFEDSNIQIQNFTCVNYYRLERVARLLGLVFDRARTAEKIYRNLESKHKVRFFKRENRTFIPRNLVDIKYQNGIVLITLTLL